GGEAEPPATLDDLGDAVDRHDPLEVGTLLRSRTRAAAPAFAPLTTLAALVARATGATGPATASSALWTWHQMFLSLVISEFQSGFAGRISERGDPSGVGVAATVEDNLGHTGILGRLGKRHAQSLGFGGLVAVGQLVGRARGQRPAGVVIDNLHEQ